MFRVLLVFIILVTLVLFPARSWLCQPANTAIRVVTSPCDDTLSIELASSAISLNTFSLLTPALMAIGPNVGISALAYLPLLNPEEPVQFEVDPPPRTDTSFSPLSTR